MKNLIFIVALLMFSGCAAGAATSGYAIRAGSADDLSSKAKALIVEEAVEKANAYTDLKLKG